jgi:hypothetical protein
LIIQNFIEKNKVKVIDTSTNIIYGSLSEVCELINMTKYKLSQYLRGTRTNKTTFKYL